jgi:hypothetical protein
MFIAGDPDLAKWTEHSARRLIDSLPHFKDWPVASVEELVRMSAEAGVPGLISIIAGLRVPSTQFAARYDASVSRLQKEWVEGV